MSDNLRIWSVFEKTDPSQTKGFTRSGGFKGTAVKPIYCDQRMTEMFGPCGEGWGINRPEFQVVPTEKEILVFCTVSIWHGSRDNVVHGVGGDKVVSMTTNGPKTSDEAFKMAFTDAVGNAYKHLGMSADIHQGKFDDSKYVDSLKKEIAASSTAHVANEEVATATGEVTPVRGPIEFANDLATDLDLAMSAKEISTIQTREKNAAGIARMMKMKDRTAFDIYTRALNRAVARVPNVMEAGE